MDLESLKRDVTAWLGEHWNPDQTLLEWRLKLLESGWGAPSWPIDYYGRGLPVSAVETVDDVFTAHGALGAASIDPLPIYVLRPMFISILSSSLSCVNLLHFADVMTRIPSRHMSRWYKVLAYSHHET